MRTSLAGLLILLALSACVSQPSELGIAPPGAAEPAAPTEPSAPPATETALPATETLAGPPALESGPLPVAFSAADGQALSGLYYPASVNPAPLIVLMHWAPGGQLDWNPLALWLQNRGGALHADVAGSALPWRDPTGFPALGDRSYAVFTFSYRGCDDLGGCRSFDPQGWALDSQAAMQTARDLEGIDPARIFVAGASIGADGAGIGCESTGCAGVFSISPGSYLDRSYATIVESLLSMSPPVPVWCLAAEEDRESAPACLSVSSSSATVELIPGSAHGLALFDSALTPNAFELLLEALARTTGP